MLNVMLDCYNTRAELRRSWAPR